VDSLQKPAASSCASRSASVGRRSRLRRLFDGSRLRGPRWPRRFPDVFHVGLNRPVRRLAGRPPVTGTGAPVARRHRLQLVGFALARLSELDELAHRVSGNRLPARARTEGRDARVQIASVSSSLTSSPSQPPDRSPPSTSVSSATRPRSRSSAATPSSYTRGRDPRIRPRAAAAPLRPRRSPRGGRLRTSSRRWRSFYSTSSDGTLRSIKSTSGKAGTQSTSIWRTARPSPCGHRQTAGAVRPHSCPSRLCATTRAT